MSQGAKSRVAVRGGQLNHGRMPCPTCNEPISLPFDALIAGQPLWCSRCGTRLSVDLAASRAGIEALRKARENMENLKRTAEGQGS